MSRSNDLIKEAYKKGYRVTDEGLPISHKGKVLSLQSTDKVKYPRISFALNGKRETVLMHRFAAYCFYGDATFEKDIQVRHLNSDATDLSKTNIALGTAKENDNDKTDEARKRSTDAVISASRGRAPVNRIFDTKQVEEIRAQIGSGVRGRDLAIKYGVSDAVISLIKTGKSYYV